MHDDPTMRTELANRLYPGFEAKWRIAEIVGRTAMLGVIVAAIAGLLGGGPIKVWSRVIEKDGLAVTYQPVARFGTPSGLDVVAAVEAGAKEIGITFPDALAAGFDLQAVTPQPIRREAGPDTMRFVFAPMQGAKTVQVHLGGMPPGAGWLHLSARLDGRPPLSWSQFIMP